MKNETLTVTQPGQPSPELLAKLKEAGARITDEQIETVFEHAEQARIGFVCQAIAAGVLLLAKKQSLRHGQWMPWCERFGAAYAGKLVTRVQFGDKLASRSLRRYAFLAQHFLADLEQAAFRPEERDTPVASPEVTPSEVLAIETLGKDQRIAVWNRIERFVAGRSLRSMLSDLRRADAAGEQEEIEAATPAKRPSKAAKDAAGQLDFWDEMNRPLTELDTLMSSPDFVERTTKDGWLKLAAELTAKAKLARELAEKIR